jgi:hypothetical protein
LKSKFALFAFLFIPVVGAAAPPILDLIDVPTAEVVDRYGYDASFRFYGGGGMLAKGTFGVFSRFNMGLGIDTEGFIGSGSADFNTPTIHARWRVFDGRRYWPAIAIGYDGQGAYYNDKEGEYRLPEKGVYIVGSGEILVPNLSLHAGVNKFGFQDDGLYGFAGLRYSFQDILGLRAEWDNVHHMEDSRVNAGVEVWVSPSFSVEFDFRDLLGPGYDRERMVRLAYSGGF